MNFTGIVRIGLWLLSRVGIYVVLVIAFKLWQNATGEKYLNDAFGLQFGFGLPLVLLAATVLSATVWLISGNVARFHGRARSHSRAFSQAIRVCAIIEGLLTGGQLMLLFPASIPFVLLSLVVGAGSAWLLSWAHSMRTA